MQVCHTVRDVREVLPRLPRPLGLVPTMGALHAGHLSLVAASVAANHTTAVSIFLNPSQFGPSEDLSRYPRNLQADLALLGQAGVDLVFAPEAGELYPPGFATWVTVEGPPAVRLEADRRPGHFRGVATIVAKLLLIVGPDAAYFGQKDAQQLAVVRRMVADLNIPVTIVAEPTVREPDGLALSSRNVYLQPAERQAATVLSRSIARAQRCYQSGERAPLAILEAMRAEFRSAPLAMLDYVALADPATLQPVGTLAGETLALVACHVGTTHLIDNAPLAAPHPLTEARIVS
jgi:pantoate--beta-alanine ligase